MTDDIFEGRGAPLSFYRVKEETWPLLWRLPEVDEDAQDLFGKIIYLTDDLLLRTMVNVWDNVLRHPGIAVVGAIQGGAISAHARFTVSVNPPTFDLERAANAVRQSWLGMAKQAFAAQARGCWEGGEVAPDEAEESSSGIPDETLEGRLIAAGPDLLAALRDLVEIERRDNLTDPAQTATDRHREETWDAARAAIAKATGGAK